MRKSRKTKVPLKNIEIRLIVCILDRLNTLILHDMTWGTLGVVSSNNAKELDKRLRKRLLKEGCEAFQVSNQDYDLTKDFFRGLCILLKSFVRLNGLGNEFDKRLAEQYIHTAKSLVEFVGEGG